MMGEMTQLHITEAEASRDFAAVLRRIGHGEEVVVDRDGMPVAIVKPPPAVARTMFEIISAMEASGACGIADPAFAHDVEQGIAARNQPWDPPAWT